MLWALGVREYKDDDAENPPLSHDFGTSDMCRSQSLRTPSLVQAVHGVANVDALLNPKPLNPKR